MDINALLSPNEAGGRESSASSVTPSPRAFRSARPAGGKRTASGLGNEIRREPEAFPSRPTSAHFAPPSSFVGGSGAEAAPNFRPLQPPPTSNPSPAAVGASPVIDAYVQQRPGIAHRPSSTPELNVLASVAHSHARQTLTSRANSATDIHQHLQPTPQRSPSYAHSTSAAKPLLFRNASGKSSTDLIMAEAPAQTPPPRDFGSSALTETESSAITDLLNHLAQKSYDYDSHTQLVNLLHKGFLAHVYPPADGVEQQTRDPRSYALLVELRQAREAMDTRFAVGEDLWTDWLSDEVLLATNSEERISVTELCGKAVQDEPASVKLWQIYADWVQANYASCNNLEGSDQSKWSEEDKEMCKELFTRDMLVNVLEQGIQATQWRVDQSHLLWDRYAELVLQDVSAQPPAQDVEHVRNIFFQRLQVPQATWGDTAQMLYQTMSRLDPNNWEVMMDQVTEISQPAKTQMGLRETHELDLQRAIDSGSKDAAYNELVKYLGWERKQTKLKRRASFEPELLCMLYERALLLFPTYVNWWLDYIDFVITSNTSTAALPVIERATRHCPWSGDLWSRRILQSDVEGKSREDIEATKHRATNSGLLDVGGMEELLKVLQQWCSYLRRHAFSTANDEDEIDTAEFGISSALQDIDDAGRKIYGKDFEGDPLYRLETIQMKFLSEARRFDEAREVYKSLVPKQKSSHDFWARYYHWELWLWGYDRILEKHRVETAENGPQRATAVIREALSQRDLDWPERVLDLFLYHFQQHESGLELREALIEAREFQKHLAIRRAKEAEDAAALAAQQPVYQPADVRMADEGEAPSGGKRKREDDALTNGHSEKKTKTGAGAAPPADFGEPSGSASAQIKRDRENNTITVKNLPAHIQELDVRKFFKEIGDPVSITLIPDTITSTATATVEFSTNEDVLAAKTRNGKDLLGYEVRILGGSQSTLYVANYPPEFDEAAMRKLFEGYGEIISVRFPSLKFNNRRRFCYIQFLTTEMARGAEDALDGKMLDGSHKLLAKISDPDAKKSREGAQAEGRELFVKNLDRETKESEVKAFFELYGNVVSMNMVKLVSGKRTGTAFIIFSSADEATKALDANNKPFNDRVLHVEIASAKGRAAPLDRARREDINIKQSASPEPGNDTEPNGRRGSNASSQPKDDESWRTARERKVAIFNLPETVNDARVRAAMESHGPLVKIQMRRQDKGAIVEFANVQDAFNVRQGVDCTPLGTDVKTGDVADLLAKVRKRQGGDATGGDAPAASGNMMRPPAISRPGGGGRGRGRGGLGFKRGGGFGAGRGAGAEGEGTGKRSNADFKAMFEKSRDDGA